EEPVREPSTRQPARIALSRRSVLIACVVGVVLAVGITGALVATNVMKVGEIPSAVDPLRAAGAAAVEAAGSIASKVTDRINPPAAPIAPVMSKPSAPAAIGPVRVQASKPVTPAARPAPVLPVAGVPDVTRSDETRVSADETRASPIDERRDEAAAAPPNAPAMDRAIATAIYSEADADVVPPVVVYPQFPSALLGTPGADAATFDVVIDRSGKVESVKVRHAPRSIANAIVLTMSLSAAKAWRFQPAIRNGQPVRYRKSIWLPPTP
ncbi:MAG: hypothetical protein ACREQ1_16680, partial [Woeseiaceae bacterium]